ncbi:recombinase family protein [Aquamicrobium defluvii]|uniref:DNA invertase Pin-like site-specific DNA recombinase n=1 Tax=Aquamicrobium defluvii TaxID=69279 RepID=A0A4R6YF75_9HYPH|nr:recombinase family protein [Aquamicrobium defluvii]TDR34825.1 DNA invertase Pin-like site-specific DNA recombinase [Aquamicrobium defluvii]
MTKPTIRKLRCAIYTRKSSEEGLEQEFNSLDAQREACEAYIASQRSEGWVLVRDQYDDGGISGGTLERPALKHLLADIEDGLIDVVVVYKIDRLSRSLMDFSKLVEVFDRNGVTFVSVTQSFNTTTSMGRLTLNILLSFAQFEREVTAERIRDKFAASRKKGMWMGGVVPLGYRVESRKLVIEETEAAMVRMIFERFVSVGSATVLAKALAAENMRTRRGKLVDKGVLYKLLNNRVYIGEAMHKGESYPGEHKAIIDRALWDKVHAILQTSPRKRASNTRAQTPALLKGLLFGPDGAAFSPTHTKKGNKLYRYYVSQSVLKRGADACSIGRVPAAEVESADKHASPQAASKLRGSLTVAPAVKFIGVDPCRRTSPRPRES